MRSKGTASELEARRRVAVARLDDGWSQAQVADFLGVHPVTVAKWMARRRRHGEAGAHLVLIDETGLFLSPLVKRSWAKVGQTPVLDVDGGHRDKVSVIAGLSVSPAARRLGLYFATEPDGFFTADKVVPFLRDLLKHLRGQVVVVWDPGGNH